MEYCLDDILSSVYVINALKHLSTSRELKVIAWNMERGKQIELLSQRVKDINPDIILASELDVGMARSGNINTIKTLAENLEMDCRYVVEFIEHGHGNQTEMQECKLMKNNESLHCNVILSKRKIIASTMIRFEQKGLWKGLNWHSDRDGARCALFCEIEYEDTSLVTVVSHFECLTNANERQHCMKQILHHLSRYYSKKPVILGGDFNTSELPPVLESLSMEALACHEPIFKELEQEGFDWHNSNTLRHTRRQLPNGFPKPPFKKVDWLFLHKLFAADAMTLPATDAAGNPLSDHEIVSVRILM
jgi:endonuclease/exonuclease/phosphatase family metal-dependent hydrolase